MNPLQMDVSGTFLEDLDEQNQKVEFRELMTNSVWYVLLNRCGLDVQEYLDAEDFRHITDFNQLKVMGHLGSSVNEISRPVLMQIGRYVLDDLEKDLKTVAVKCIFKFYLARVNSIPVEFTSAWIFPSSFYKILLQMIPCLCRRRIK